MSCSRCTMWIESFLKALLHFSERRGDMVSGSIESFIPKPALKSFTIIAIPGENTLKNIFSCPSPRALSTFDILLDLKRPRSFLLNRVTFLALLGFLGGQLSLLEENKWQKYHLCSQGTSMALGKSFMLESPQLLGASQLLKKEKEKITRHEFSSEIFTRLVHWWLLISLG